MICRMCLKPVIRKQLLDFFYDLTLCDTCIRLKEKALNQEKIPFFNHLLTVSHFPKEAYLFTEAYALEASLKKLWVSLPFEAADEILGLFITLHLEDVFYLKTYLTLDHVQKLTDLERLSLGYIH